jgi:hypothetical protein
MTTSNGRTLEWLLEDLCDPFAIFPLQDVARSLKQSIEDSQEAFREREGPTGVARAFWDVPMELLNHGIGIAMGSAFVLGQAAITQGVSIVTRIRQLTNQHPSVPRNKRQLLETECYVAPRSGLSTMVIIDTGANYFKHHHEWPEDWHAHAGSPTQAHTMNDALRLGLSGQDLVGNMHAILHGLGLSVEDIHTVPMLVQKWRENVGRMLSRELAIHVSWLEA